MSTYWKGTVTGKLMNIINKYCACLGHVQVLAGFVAAGASLLAVGQVQAAATPVDLKDDRTVRSRGEHTVLDEPSGLQ
jgi:hypothetical protein